MKMLKLVEKRRSVREYKGRALNISDRNFLDEVIKDVPELAKDASLEIVFVEDGARAQELLEGTAGYYGHMIEAPHYYALFTNPDKRCYKITGYVGEWLILKATQQEIGTCWIEVKDSEKAKDLLGFESPKRLVALIAVGYAKRETRLSNIYEAKRGSLSTLTDLGYPNINPNFTKEPVSNRKSITEFVYLKEWGNVPTLEELEQRGLHEVFFYMRLAPSYSNRQPWYFIIKGNEILLALAEDEAVAPAMVRIEAGIAMLYFEVAMHDSGVSGHWIIEDFEDGVPEGYQIMGKYTY
jgi:nitroreductase